MPSETRLWTGLSRCGMSPWSSKHSPEQRIDWPHSPLQIRACLELCMRRCSGIFLVSNTLTCFIVRTKIAREAAFQGNVISTAQFQCHKWYVVQTQKKTMDTYSCPMISTSIQFTLIWNRFKVAIFFWHVMSTILLGLFWFEWDQVWHDCNANAMHQMEKKQLFTINVVLCVILNDPYLLQRYLHWRYLWRR